MRKHRLITATCATVALIALAPAALAHPASPSRRETLIYKTGPWVRCSSGQRLVLVASLKDGRRVIYCRKSPRSGRASRTTVHAAPAAAGKTLAAAAWRTAAGLQPAATPAAQAAPVLSTEERRTREAISAVLHQAGFVRASDRRVTIASYIPELDKRTYAHESESCAAATLLRSYIAAQLIGTGALHLRGSFVWRWHWPSMAVKLVLYVPRCGASRPPRAVLTVARFVPFSGR